MPPLLALDTAHFTATGVYTLVNRPRGLFFTFGDTIALGAFLSHYYRNPIAAQFAYYKTQKENRS